ncbi:MAG TPA: YciI family protein [Baekduia sp.]|nr:YciI family protein [Baekduia sp.]
MRQLTVLVYEYVPDVLERRGPYREEHLATLRDDPAVVMGGALGDPPHGALFVFETSEAAEAFVARDPYQAAGLVTAWRVEPWAVAV